MGFRIHSDEQIEKTEANEVASNREVCGRCGNDTFHLYIAPSSIIDDARVYCTKCGCDDTVTVNLRIEK